VLTVRSRLPSGLFAGISLSSSVVNSSSHNYIGSQVASKASDDVVKLIGSSVKVIQFGEK
jgi:hypothetical protein